MSCLSNHLRCGWRAPFLTNSLLWHMVFLVTDRLLLHCFMAGLLVEIPAASTLCLSALQRLQQSF
jgi:hypothetical protein